jgi:hypothetical protein
MRDTTWCSSKFVRVSSLHAPLTTSESSRFYAWRCVELSWTEIMQLLLLRKSVYSCCPKRKCYLKFPFIARFFFNFKPASLVLISGFLLGLLFGPEDDDMFLRNVGGLLPKCQVLQSRISFFSYDIHSCWPKVTQAYATPWTLTSVASYPCNRPWRPIGLWEVEASTFSLDNRLTDGGKVVSLTRRPPFTSPGRFLVLISVRG